MGHRKHRFYAKSGIDMEMKFFGATYVRAAALRQIICGSGNIMTDTSGNVSDT